MGDGTYGDKASVVLLKGRNNPDIMTLWIRENIHTAPR